MASKASWGKPEAQANRTPDVTRASGKPERRLLTIEQAVASLNLTEEEVRQLIATRQLTLLSIMGHERIDSWDVDGLITTYKRTAMRRAV